MPQHSPEAPMPRREAFRAVLSFLDYVEDFGRLNGGAMRAKYEDDPTEGYEALARRGRALVSKVRAAALGEPGR